VLLTFGKRLRCDRNGPVAKFPKPKTNNVTVVHINSYLVAEQPIPDQPMAGAADYPSSSSVDCGYYRRCSVVEKLVADSEACS
jgi:hypothetical protein